MTPAEVRAHNRGVASVLALAQCTSEAMLARLLEKPTRYSFAAEALAGLAEEGRALLLPMPPSAGTAAPISPRPTPRPAPAAATA